MRIFFPPREQNGELVPYEGIRRFVVLGANGSGKTRLGIWVETHNQPTVPVHRVSAQKVLSIPDHAAVRNVAEAEMDLFVGRVHERAKPQHKTLFRWKREPATHILSDYTQVLSLLFARTAQRDREHTERTRSTQQYIPVPDSPIESIISVWDDLMPHRSISLRDGMVMVGAGPGAEYPGKEMSDGERVMLYLLGQCLCAPENSVIIIDEPEIHLHKALVDKLWNAVERLCSDKTLIYITHDLDFAASRFGATKIWVQSYNSEAWEWMEVPSDAVLPEGLVLELIGNRKPVLFCEGVPGGLDHTLYQLCFPHRHVVPRGGWEKVVEATKALRANTAFHTISAVGIVDRDVRSTSECEALTASGVSVLDLAELENVFCLDAVIRLASAKLCRDPNTVSADVASYLASAFRGELEAQVAMHVERRIRYRLSQYSKNSSDERGLQEGLDALLTTINIPASFAEVRSTLEAALERGSRDELLRVYNRSSLASRISSFFGLGAREYPNYVLRVSEECRGRSAN